METPTIPPLSKIPYFCLSNFPRLFEARQVEAVAELLRSVSLFVSKMEEEPQKKKKQRGSQCNREQGTVYFLESFVDTLAVWVCGRISTEVISPGFPDGEYYCLYWSPDFSSAVTMRLAFMALVKCLDCWLVCHKIHPYPILFHKCHLYSLNFSSSFIIRSTFYGLNTKYLWFPIPPTSAMEC